MDLLHDTELISLRLAALATVKRKETSGMSSSSSWGSPESVTQERDVHMVQPCEEETDIASRSGLEALQSYESPKTVSVADITNIEEEEKFLYGNFAVLQELPKTSQEEPLNTLIELPITSQEPLNNLVELPKGLEWSDEEDDSLSAVSRFDDFLKSNSTESRSDFDDFGTKENPMKTEDDSAENISHLEQQQLLVPALHESDEEREIKYSQTESFLKTEYIADEINLKSGLGVQHSAEATSKLLTAKSSNYVQNENEKLNKCKEGSEIPEGNVPSKCQLALLAAEFFTKFVEDRKLETSESLTPLAGMEKSYQPVSERTICLEQTKTSTQTEKIVLKTCDKKSSTVMSTRPCNKTLSRKHVDNLNRYLKRIRDNSHSQSEESKRSSHSNSEDGAGSKIPSRSFESTADSKQEVKYEDVCGKHTTQDRSRKTRKKTEKSKYSRTSSYDYSPRGRSRRSESYHRSSRHRSRDKWHSSYDHSPGRRDKSESCRRSPGRRDKSESYRRSPGRRDKSESYRRSPGRRDKSESCRRSLGRHVSRDRSLSYRPNPKRYSRSRSRSRHRRSRSHSREKPRSYRSPSRYSRVSYSQDRSPKRDSYDKRDSHSNRHKYRKSRSRSRGKTESRNRGSTYRYRRSESSEERIISRRVRSRDHSRCRRRRSKSSSSYCSLSFESSEHS